MSNTEQIHTTILSIEGEKPESGWQLEFTTNNPLELPDGTKAFSAKIARADGKYHSGEYLPANSDYNPAGYGQMGIVEHGKEGIVGSIITVLSRDENGQVMVAFTEAPGRLGNRGVEPMIESKREVQIISPRFSQSANIQFLSSTKYIQITLA